MSARWSKGRRAGVFGRDFNVEIVEKQRTQRKIIVDFSLLLCAELSLKTGCFRFFRRPAFFRTRQR